MFKNWRGIDSRRWVLALSLIWLIAASGESAEAQSKFAVAAYKWDGYLNIGFGGSGLVATDFTSDFDATATAVAIDSLGRAIVAGRARGEFALARYNPDGTLDARFGAGGRVLTHIGGTGDAGIKAIVFDSVERIVVAGRANKMFAVARYNDDGTLDATFGSNGVLLTPFSRSVDADDEANALLVDQEDRIIAAGRARVNQDSHIAIVRYLANGSTDPSFGMDGRVLSNIDMSTQSKEQATALATDPSGRLLVGGNNFGGPYGDNTGGFVLRYKGSGEVDSTFGISSDPVKHTVVHHTFYEDFVVNSIGTDDVGRVYVAGRFDKYSDDSKNSTFALARLSTSGYLDPGFNSPGPNLSAMYYGYPSSAMALRIYSGKIVSVGWSTDGTLSGRRMMMTRHLLDGGFDGTFGGTGVITTDFACPGSEQTNALAIRMFRGEPAPRIYSAGSANANACAWWMGIPLP